MQLVFCTLMAILGNVSSDLIVFAIAKRTSIPEFVRVKVTPLHNVTIFRDSKSLAQIYVTQPIVVLNENAPYFFSGTERSDR